ncbi:hypothetical protein C8R43DRAFT_970524 [Mycena crocata]|nr:hypothetical protein C8R43DRAFT_970524 [Mycena crocata]
MKPGILPPNFFAVTATVALCAALLFHNNVWHTLNRTVHSYVYEPTRQPSDSFATEAYKGPHFPPSSPDVTAVLLNWARRANVVQIVSLLCGVEVVKEVVIWNNNHLTPLRYEDFATCNCSSPDKVRIYNSPENLYFQARFIACSNVSTPYCFIQDDDYLVKPEIIRSLRARIDKDDIFLSPPHEVLSSQLLSIRSPSTNITLGFSWLGYGSLILKSHAESFLSLLGRLGASDEETKMADNYYSILRNRIPELWTGAPIALFGGGDFTVGDEGVARNRKHIATAYYLDIIMAYGGEWPYVLNDRAHPEPRLERSPCTQQMCLLETNIQVFPQLFAQDTNKPAGELFVREAELSMALTDQFASHYVDFPLFHAVDSDPDTFFLSFWNVVAGDTLILDAFNNVQQNLTNVDWLWLVDTNTSQVLRASTYSYSSDKLNWVAFPGSVSCHTYSHKGTISSSSPAMLECRVRMEGLVNNPR